MLKETDAELEAKAKRQALNDPEKVLFDAIVMPGHNLDPVLAANSLGHTFDEIKDYYLSDNFQDALRAYNMMLIVNSIPAITKQLIIDIIGEDGLLNCSNEDDGISPLSGNLKIGNGGNTVVLKNKKQRRPAPASKYELVYRLAGIFRKENDPVAAGVREDRKQAIKVSPEETLAMLEQAIAETREKLDADEKIKELGKHKKIEDKDVYSD